MNSPTGHAAIDYSIRTINAWIQRRLDKGVRATSDEIIARIKHNWPRLSEEQIDEIYRHTK